MKDFFLFSNKYIIPKLNFTDCKTLKDLESSVAL